MKTLIDLTGQRFGRLTVIEPTGRYHRGNQFWLVVCDCGQKKEVAFSSLRSGDTKSCGGHSRQGGDHRLRKPPTRGEIRAYHSWKTMRQRCRNPNNARFPSYGGRGISVCERWNKFVNFLADMGPRRDGFTIERVDVNGNYCPENCIWLPRYKQGQNRQDSRHLEIWPLSQRGTHGKSMGG
jgi:hypothetical protein